MSKKKIIIVGASHGGQEAAYEILDRYDDVDVTIYEAGDFVSFMSCGMKLFLEGKTTGQDNVRNFTPEDLAERGGKVVNNTAVTALDPAKKTVTVKNVKDGTTKEVSYDKLIISSGVNPASLPLPGADLKNIMLMRGYDCATEINAAAQDEAIKNVAVIGAGNGIG